MPTWAKTNIDRKSEISRENVFIAISFKEGPKVR
jgi:hypothetical protein